MLGGVKFRVGYSHERNCFAYISSKYCTNNDQAQSVQILWKGRQIMLWAVFSSGITEGIISINPIHSRLLYLEEGAEVYVSPYSGIKVLDELFVVPDSPDDQEIVEQNAELLQLNLLNQLRLVMKNQRAVVWISPSLPIVFTPKQTGLLVNHSSVIVKMDAFLNLPHSPLHAPSKERGKDEKKTINNVEIILDGLLRPYYNIPKTKALRALPIECDGSKNIVHPYRVFMHENLIPTEYNDGITVLATMEAIPFVIDTKSTSENDTSSNPVKNAVCVEVIPVNNVVFKSLSREDYDEFIPTVIIPVSLNNILNLDNGQKIIFNFIPHNLDQPEHIEILTYSDDNSKEDDIVNKFKQLVVESINASNTFVLNDGLTVQQKQISNGVLSFNLRPDKLKFTVLKSDSLRNCSVAAKCLDKIDKTFVSKKTKSEMEYESKNYCRSVNCVEDMVKNALFHLKFEVCREAHFKGASEIKGNILVTGSSGSGKSALCELLAKDITYWSHTVQCRSLRGRKDVPEVLGKAILTCQEHSPSVLFCDDVDALVPPDTDGGAPQDIAYYNRLAVVIKYMLQTCTGVCVLMTAVTVKALHPLLREFRGKPMFTAHFEIPELQQSERLQFLKHLLNEDLLNDFHVDDEVITKMAMDTSGQHFRDLLDYVNHKIYKAVKKKYANRTDELPSLMEDDIVDTDNKDIFDIWGPLGGLHDVKQQLTESIFWPMMYPALFPSQSCGILLFGPPGTGKSFIGSCLARLGSMSFLSVKGPELLSKYIGQSEKAVRDIFDKADMKRPCILFFDEFDSLAPKRGHDSTGVTDRVVNQLLVRLDGAEGGARGPVIAATNRPDLIDPALLRPGRLDIHIYCPLPDHKGRVEVLQTLGSSVSVSADVNLDGLASHTEGFSPADLKALLVTAQLTALEKQLESGEGSKLESVVVSGADVQSALLETRPSLSPRQRLFYHTINKRFRGERLTVEEMAELQGSQKQRVTLA